MKKHGRKLQLIAKGDSNWDYYLTEPYSDGSQAIWYIAKEGSGANDGIYCGVSGLRAHFKDLQRITGYYDSLVPRGWSVIDHDFFRALGIPA